MLRRIFERAITAALNSHRDSWFKVEGLRGEISNLRDDRVRLQAGSRLDTSCMSHGI